MYTDEYVVHVPSCPYSTRNAWQEYSDVATVGTLPYLPTYRKLINCRRSTAVDVLALLVPVVILPGIAADSAFVRPPGCRQRNVTAGQGSAHLSRLLYPSFSHSVSMQCIMPAHRVVPPSPSRLLAAIAFFYLCPYSTPVRVCICLLL